MVVVRLSPVYCTVYVKRHPFLHEYCLIFIFFCLLCLCGSVKVQCGKHPCLVFSFPHLIFVVFVLETFAQYCMYVGYILHIHSIIKKNQKQK